MRQIEIKKNDSGQTLLKFLQKRFPTMPRALLHKYLRTKYIKLGGKKADGHEKLTEGDTLTLYIKDEFFEDAENRTDTPKYEFLKAPNELSIVYEDENILLTDKKPGLLVHQDIGYNPDCLIFRIMHYLYKKNEYNPEAEASFAPALCNRIDRNTGGIVIAAKNAETLRILNEKIKERELDKLYLCVCFGSFKKKADTLTHYLKKDESKNRVFISNSQGDDFKTIKTRYEVKSEQGDFSLVEVELLTGRTHQIRAHMAYIGHPLVGDGKYGKNTQNKACGYTRQALYSYKLKFNFKSDAGILNYLNQKEFAVKEVWFADKSLKRISADF